MLKFHFLFERRSLFFFRSFSMFRVLMSRGGFSFFLSLLVRERYLETASVLDIIFIVSRV